MDLTGMLQAAAGASTGNPNAWDISFAYYDPGADAGNVSKAAYTGTSSTLNAAGEGVGNSIYIRPDGLKIYTVDSSNDAVYQFSLSSPWNISTITYDSKSFSISAQETNPRDLFFKPDGTKMYIVGQAGKDVNEYDLSTAWDVSSASFVQNFSIVAQEDNPTGLFFKPDGTKMYVTGADGDDINEYDLSTPWDISTASYIQNFSFSAQDTEPRGTWFSNDGIKMYVVGDTGNDVNEYTLSTPWDVSSASFVQVFSISSQTTSPQGFVIDPNGGVFFVNAGSTVFQYTIGGFSVAAQEANPADVFFKDDGTKMYITGTIGDDVNEYDLSTAWDITTASYLQVFSVAAQETNPTSLFFKPDGLKMYVLGTVGQDVNEYALSTPWDVSSSSYTTNFSTASQAPQPRGCWFKPDGTKMYVSCATNDAVYQYSLSTAWSVSSASYDSVSFSVASQETVPQALVFKPDGTKMYVVGSAGDDVNEYDLSTPWDISSASYVQNYGVLDSVPNGLYWRDNGEEFFIVGSNNDRVLKYTISST
jgi:sugar lactone lactonase YvrE